MKCQLRAILKNDKFSGKAVLFIESYSPFFGIYDCAPTWKFIIHLEN